MSNSNPTAKVGFVPMKREVAPVSVSAVEALPYGAVEGTGLLQNITTFFRICKNCIAFAAKLW